MSVTGLTGVFGLHRQIGASNDLDNPNMTAKGPYNAGIGLNASQTTVQSLSFTNVTGGHFRLAFRGQFTESIEYSATGATLASRIQTALNGIPELDGEVAVSGTGPFVVNFAGGEFENHPVGVTIYDHKLAPAGIATMHVANTSTGGRWYYLPATSVNFQPQQIVQSIPPEVGGDLWARGSYKGGVHGEGQVMMVPRGGLGLAELFLAFTGTKIVPTTSLSNFGQVINEVQVLTKTGTWSSGNFTLTFGAQTTGPIAWNADADAIRLALEALGNVDPGDVVVSGGPISTTAVNVAFTGRFSGADVSPLAANVSGVTGTTPGIGITTQTGGMPLGTKLVGSGAGGWNAAMPGAGNYKYRFIPQSGTAAELPWYTLIRNVGGRFVEEFADARLGNFAFDLASTNILNVDASFISRRVGTIAVGSGPSAVGSQKAGNGLPFQSVDAIVKLDTNSGSGPGPAIENESLLPTRLNIGFANQLSNNEHVVGSYYLQDITNQSRTANVTYSMYLKDPDMYARAYAYGADIVTQDAAWSSRIWKGSLAVTLKGGQIGSTADFYRIDIVIPEMDYMATPISLAGNNLVEYQLTTNVVLSQSAGVYPFYIDYTTDEDIV